MDLKESR